MSRTWRGWRRSLNVALDGAAAVVVAGCLALATCGQGASEASADSTASGVSQEPASLAQADAGDSGSAAPQNVPDWAMGAVFYQIFPERFCNGDPSNDPTRESLEFPDNVSDKWRISPWAGDWYERDDWERERGDDFYEDGVFDRRYGGDLAGVLSKLDYLQRLGVDVIYFNPVFYARSLHKYDANTYHHIDPYFGPDPKGDLKLIERETSDPQTWSWTAADRLFLQLVQEAHDRDIRVIIDGVFNHTGRGFFAFADLLKNQQQSPYKDWYIVQSFDDPATPDNEFRYKGWWDVDTLPEFADTPELDNLHPGPKAYVFDATRRWMDPNGDGDPEDGIDGWRLDVATESPLGFWREWHQVVRSLNPDAYTVAEHWDDAAGFIAEGGFSATMNYHGFAFPTKGFLIDGVLSPSGAASMLQDRLDEYPVRTRHALLTLIDSHDTDRVASMIVNASRERPYVQPERYDYDVSERVSPRNWDGYDIRKPNARERRIQRMVALLQATFPGAPMFYYGAETGMWGGDDPCDRMPMVWEGAPYQPASADPLRRPREPDSQAVDKDLWRFYQAVMSLRKQLAPLRTGQFAVTLADDRRNTLAFERRGVRNTVFVFFNRSEEEQEVSVPAPGPGVAIESFTASGKPDLVTVQRQSGKISVRMPALEGVVVLFKPEAN